MKNNFLYIIIGAMLIACLSGCGKKEAKAETGEIVVGEAETMQSQSNPDFEYDENGERTAEESEMTIMEDGEELTFISEDSALSLATEVVENGMSVSFNRKIDKQGDYYYLFDVESKGKKLEQQIAIHAISGEVSIYDTKDHMILPYEEFEAYNPEMDSDIRWEGIYEADDNDEEQRKLKILAIDPSSNEVTFYIDDDKKYVGVINMDSKIEGQCSLADGTYLFSLDGATLTIKSKDVKDPIFEGTYTLTDEAVE